MTRLGGVVWAVVLLGGVLPLAAGGQATAAPATAVAAAPQAAPAKPGSVNCKVKNVVTEADKALSREDYEAALRLYGEQAATDPDASRAGTIRVLLGQDKVDDAQVAAEAWVKEAPAKALAQETLGEVYLRAGIAPPAYDQARKAQRLDPCLGRVYFLLGEMEDLSAMFARSRTHFVLAHRLAPADLEVRRAWIGTLPRSRRLAELTQLSQDSSVLNDKNRHDLSEYVQRAKDATPHDCEVADKVDSAKIGIQRIMDGPNRVEGLALDVKFNGKRRRLEIDTGASGLVLSRSAASGLGLVRERQARSYGVGDEGDVTTSIAYVDSIRIGDLEFRNCEVEILEKRSALDIDGLIGGNVFSRFLLTLDFPNAQLRLDPLPPRPDEVAKGDAPEKLKTAPGKPQADGVNAGDSEEPVVHDAYMAPSMKDWTPVLRSGHDLLIPVSIGDTRERLFLVDTGSGLMSISPEAARAVTKVHKDDMMQVHGISGKVDKVYYTGHFLFRFAQLGQQVDSMTAMSTTKLSHDAGVEISGFLGAPILDRLTVHIDYRDNLMKFDYVKGN